MTEFPRENKAWSNTKVNLLTPAVTVKQLEEVPVLDLLRLVVYPLYSPFLVEHTEDLSPDAKLASGLWNNGQSAGEVNEQ